MARWQLGCLAVVATLVAEAGSAQEACMSKIAAMRPIVERYDRSQIDPSLLSRLGVLTWKAVLRLRPAGSPTGSVGDVSDAELLSIPEMDSLRFLPDSGLTPAPIGMHLAEIIRGESAGFGQSQAVIAARVYRLRELDPLPAARILASEGEALISRHLALYALGDRLRDSLTVSSALVALCALGDRHRSRLFLDSASTVEFVRLGLNSTEYEFLVALAHTLSASDDGARSLNLQAFVPQGSGVALALSAISRNW